MVRNLHTNFDYMFNNEKKDSACGKVLAGWKLVGSNGERHGGQHSKTTMNHEPLLFNLFVKNLFFSHQDNLNDEVKKLLCVSVLLYHDEFNGIIMKEPNGKYLDWKTHPFNQRMLKALLDSGKFVLNYFFNCLVGSMNCTWNKFSGASVVDLEKWKTEIGISFKERNWISLPIENLDG